MDTEISVWLLILGIGAGMVLGWLAHIIYTHRPQQKKQRMIVRKNWIYFLEHSTVLEEKRTLAKEMLRCGNLSADEFTAIFVHIPKPHGFFERDYGKIALRKIRKMERFRGIEIPLPPLFSFSKLFSLFDLSSEAKARIEEKSAYNK